jgi:LmbE family N-acetylglucosaminyl deacetylase
MIMLARPRRLLVVSPHLDDAVLGCGLLLSVCPGAVVATLLAGVPQAENSVTDWDARCGFATGRQAMLCRRGEDLRALGALRARAVHADFLDAQYGCSPAPRDVAQVLGSIISASDPDMILTPLGLFHTDHVLIHDASLMARASAAGRRWLCYEDGLYRSKPRLLQERLSRLYVQETYLTPVQFDLPEDDELKQQALRCYASQGYQLGLARTDTDAKSSERYWLLHEDGP